MGRPPVSLAEIREHLNVDVDDTESDEEIWTNLLAATNIVEDRVGPMEVAQVSERFELNDCSALLRVAPVVGIVSITTVDGEEIDTGTAELDVDAGMLRIPSLRYAGGIVTYNVGRDPVPEALRLATKIVTGHLWELQLGPAEATGDASTGGSSLRGFAIPYRAATLMAPYRVVRIR